MAPVAQKEHLKAHPAWVERQQCGALILDQYAIDRMVVLQLKEIFDGIDASDAYGGPAAGSKGGHGNQLFAQPLPRSVISQSRSPSFHRSS
jgi:hypothetical protein